MPVEIYHIKAMGARNWNKFEQMVQKIEAARRSTFPDREECSARSPLIEL